MSDTHGIYVAGFNDGYRVAYIGCFQNIAENGLLSVDGKKRIRELFSDSMVYNFRALALEAAHDMATEYSSLGYGVTDIGHLGKFCEDTSKDGQPPTMTAEAVLRRLMKHFYIGYLGGLEWSHVEGASVQRIEGQEFFQELSKYLDDRALENLKNFSQ